METDREQSVQTAKDLKNRIEWLTASWPTITAEIDQLKARKEELMKEIEQVNLSIGLEEKKLADLPNTIGQMKEELSTQVRHAMRLHKSTKPIPGSADEDQRIISRVDEIRLRAINVIHGLLEPM